MFQRDASEPKDELSVFPPGVPGKYRRPTKIKKTTKRKEANVEGAEAAEENMISYSSVKSEV